MDALGVEGAWVFTPAIYDDSRGSFFECFRNAAVFADTGRSMEVAQVNCAVSARGAIRGVHFSDIPPGQAKYVTCLSGSILDVVVDLRVGSPGFGRWDAVLLDAKSPRAVFVAEGLGHAFMTLSDESTAFYLCSTSYAPDREHGVHPLDPGIGIAWPADVPPILSDKDAAAPSLAAALAAGLLPGYADCLSLAASMRSK
jgi:dTDP-4-dehydrorhamnose 3,5-epimerase